MKKKSEKIHHVVSIFFATLLSVSATLPAMAGGIQKKQSEEHQCNTGYIAIYTGDFSQPSAKTCLTENMGTVSIPSGTLFSVNLPDNPTTGMTWGLMKFPSSVLLISAEHTSPASCQKGMTGCNGEFTSTFKAISSGMGNIIFTHSRLWENTYPLVVTLHLKIQ